MESTAGGWRRSHRCEPSACLNLTRSESFTEFVHEVRQERRSDVLFMPQYAEPMSLRIFRTGMDVIRYYPEYAAGSRKWDERIFHPDAHGVERPLAAIWKQSPMFIEGIFSALRCFEHAPVQRALRLVLVTHPRQQQWKLDLSKCQRVLS